MKIKTSELKGAALDWAVAQIEFNGEYRPISLPDYSTDWSQGGPIIERERLCIDIGHSGVWLACSKQNYDDAPEFMNAGSTPLISAMRCYVTSKLGGCVEVPNELFKE